MDKEKLETLLTELNKKRNYVTLVTRNALNAEEDYKNTEEYQRYDKLKNEAKEAQGEADKLAIEIRELAVELSQATDYQDRKPAIGVEVKRYEEITITDSKSAKVWLSANIPSALEIKKSVFEKVIKHMEFDWVTKTEEYRAQISSDLSVYDGDGV
jgi:hypothetical protein